ncbi:MAG: molybdate ABC transporter permease subunit [Hydrogenothermaceae bacterium]|nr:molybdate ABC transporter permease subunit [Hydrogenothermaceae bacterium]
MEGLEWTPLILTIKLATITTIILLFLSIPIAYNLTYSNIRFKSVYEVIITLPLVLPPSVLGFYLLLLMGKNGILGKVWENIAGHQLAFHFEGVVLASVVFSLPFMVHPLISGFKSVPITLIEASYTLGKSKFTTLFNVILPNMKSAILTGITLSFAHTIGEFGVVLMIGGNIDGETRVISIAIYDSVEKLDYTTAHTYSFILFAVSFLTLLTVHKLNRKLEVRF